MSRLVEHVRDAIADGRVTISPHATVRCEDHGLSVWPVIDGTIHAERAAKTTSAPLPTVVACFEDAGGRRWQAIWSWDAERGIAKLVTVF